MAKLEEGPTVERRKNPKVKGKKAVRKFSWKRERNPSHRATNKIVGHGVFKKDHAPNKKRERDSSP